MVTLKDVASRAGLSIATVSRVINGNCNVAEASKEKVREAIEELGYYSNEIARSLGRESLKIVAVTLPSLNNLFYVEMLEAIDDMLTTAGYSVLFFNAMESEETEKNSLKEIRSLGIAGNILFHMDFIGNELQSLTNTDYPSVIISGREQESDENLTFVPFQIHKISELAVNHLETMGAKDIWFMSPINDGNLYLSESVINKSSCCFHWVLTNDNPKDVLRICRQYDISGDDQGFITTNDFQALGILNYLKEKQIRPKLVSIGDSFLAQNLSPAVSSVSPSGYQLGIAAAQILLSEIRGTGKEESSAILITPELIVRET